jgi:predicted Rossmann fold nucleotide-binding protein DprA/Smf involved in DNA uptake
MPYSADSTRAALLLTNRLVRLDATPMTAREFWQLVETTDPADLLHRDAAAIAERTGRELDEARRLRTLLDAATAMSFEQERLHDGGVSLISALDDRFPARLRERLGSACPPFLLVAGPVESLDTAALGVVGSHDVGAPALDAARRAAALVATHGWSVVIGLGTGRVRMVDEAATAGALEAGGVVIGVPAEGITRISRSAEIRRQVHAGELCIASPFAPDAPFRAANATGRNTILYALSRVTFVVTAADGTGGTWAGARHALDDRVVPVAVWTGDGAVTGNHALVRRGATAITDPRQLLDVGPLPPEPSQDSLF